MSYDLILKNIGKHIDLEEHEVEFFTSLLRSSSVQRKTFLLREGDVCRYENFVMSGCLKVYSIDKNGAEHVVMFAPEDWWVGDLYSFLSETASVYTIEALEDTEVLQILRKDLEELYLKVPKFERFYRIIFQKAFIAQQERISQSLSLTAEARYAKFIAKYPHLEQRLPQKQVAAYLGITPEFLSIIRKKRVKGSS